jgi:hypothetical protein
MAVSSRYSRNAHRQLNAHASRHEGSTPQVGERDMEQNIRRGINAEGRAQTPAPKGSTPLIRQTRRSRLRGQEKGE